MVRHQAAAVDRPAVLERRPGQATRKSCPSASVTKIARWLFPRRSTWWMPGRFVTRCVAHRTNVDIRPGSRIELAQNCDTLRCTSLTVAATGRGQVRPVITSLENPRVKEVLRLRKARERRRAGLFIAEGRREVERALAAGLVVQSVYFAPELIAGLARRWRRGECPRAGQDELPRRAGRCARRRRDPAPSVAGGIDAAPRRGRDREAGQPRRDGAHRRRSRRRRARSSPTPTSTRGTRTRSAPRPAPSSRCRSSRRHATQVAALPHQKIAAVLGADRRHTDADYTEPTAFLVGAEDDGLSDDWRAVADAEVEIPMKRTRRRTR